MRPAIILALVLVAAPVAAQTNTITLEARPGDSMMAVQFYACPAIARIRPAVSDEVLAVSDACGADEMLRVRALSDGWALSVDLPHCFVMETFIGRRGTRWACGIGATMAPAIFPIDGVPVLTVTPKAAHVEVWASADHCWVTAAGAECRR